MKFSAGASILFLASAAATSSAAFSPSPHTFRTIRSVSLQLPSFTGTQMSTTEGAITEGKISKSKKEERLRIMKTDTFHRRGFKEVRDQVEQDMEEQFKSEIVKDLRSNDFVVERDNVRVHLAKDYGFCWGVERSIALAYEAVNHFPNRQIHITNDLIHNPEVNDRLESMNVKLIEKTESGRKRFEAVEDNDVVILPAFGAGLDEMELLDKKNVDIVDTTCPWVSKVWNTVDTHQKKGLTSIIHGKYSHEETVATASFCEDYIIVRNKEETQIVLDYILNGGDRETFLEYFKNAISKGFDPDTMLEKVGLANQTTMYKKETREIGQMLQKAMMTKYGPVDVQNHYMEFDTICDATQERQDAIHELVENAKELNLDFILVVGGWDSSNTSHLLEIPILAGVRAFHINRADCIGADNTITHRTMGGDIVTESFLNEDGKRVIMGVTSGASTPDNAVQSSLGSIFMLKKILDEKHQEKEE